MTFQDDDGNIIEVDEEVTITKQTTSIIGGIKIKGDYSVNFNVPNNSINRKVLNYDGPQMLNQVAFTRQEFTLMRNGNPYLRGFIVIQAEEPEQLNCYFISGNSNWVNLLQGVITELNWDSYTKQFLYSSDLVTATEGMVIPFVDWGLVGTVDTLKGRGNTSYAFHSYHNRCADSVNPVLHAFNNPPPRNYSFDFYPCLYLKSLVKEILQQNGLKLSGNIVNDSLYQRIIVTPDSGEMTRTPVEDISLVGSSQTVTSDGMKLINLTKLSDPENLFSAGTYTANKYAGVTVRTHCTASTDTPNDGCYLYKNGTRVTTPWYSTTVSPLLDYNSNTVDSYLYSEIIPMAPGDTLYIGLRRAAGNYDTTINVKITVNTVINPADYVSPKNFLPKLKCIDVIKMVISLFGCSVSYEPASKTITMNIIEKLKPEDAIDVSRYYLSHRSEYTVDQAANNYVRYNDSQNTNIVAYNNIHKQKFGEGNITTDNTIKQDAEFIKIPFSTAYFSQSINGVFAGNGTLFELTDNLDPIPFTAVAAGATTAGGTTYSTFTCTKPSDFTGVRRNEIVRMVSDDSVNAGYYTMSNRSSLFTSVSIVYTFAATFAGTIYRQKISYKSNASCLMVVHIATPVSSISSGSTINVLTGYEDEISTSYSAVPFSFFAKPLINLAADTIQDNLSFDNPDIDGWSKPTIKDRYFNKISNILNGPKIRAKMLLPESIVQSFNFGSFVYLKTKDLTGYLYVESIVNYQDAGTPVEVNMYLL